MILYNLTENTSVLNKQLPSYKLDELLDHFEYRGFYNLTHPYKLICGCGLYGFYDLPTKGVGICPCCGQPLLDANLYDRNHFCVKKFISTSYSTMTDKTFRINLKRGQIIIACQSGNLYYKNCHLKIEKEKIAEVSIDNNGKIIKNSSQTILEENDLSPLTSSDGLFKNFELKRNFLSFFLNFYSHKYKKCSDILNCLWILNYPNLFNQENVEHYPGIMTQILDFFFIEKQFRFSSQNAQFLYKKTIVPMDISLDEFLELTEYPKDTDLKDFSQRCYTSGIFEKFLTSPLGFWVKSELYLNNVKWWEVLEYMRCFDSIKYVDNPDFYAFILSNIKKQKDLQKMKETFELQASKFILPF